MADSPGAGRPARLVTLPALFGTLLSVSMYGFGGPIVWARRIIVDQRGWLGDVEFADTLSFCQFLPGPNVVSLSVCLGAKFRGPAGALTALAGFILVPWTVGFTLGAIFLSYAQNAVLMQAFCAGLPQRRPASSSPPASGCSGPIGADRSPWPLPRSPSSASPS